MAQNMDVGLQSAGKVWENLVAQIRQGRRHQYHLNLVFVSRWSIGVNPLGRIEECRLSALFGENYRMEVTVTLWRVKSMQWCQKSHLDTKTVSCKALLVCYR